MKQQHEDAELIDKLGGTTAVARIFGIQPPSVAEWRERGIPAARRQTLALMYPDMTPDSWLPKTNAAGV